MKLADFPFQSRWLKCVLVAIAYGVGGGLTLHLTRMEIDSSPIWIPAGIGLAGMLLWGYELGIGIFFGDFVLMNLLGLSWQGSLTSAVGSLLSAIFAAFMLNYCHFSVKIARIRDVAALVLLAAMVAPALNATIDTVAHWLAGSRGWYSFGQRWWILWLGDCSGILVITPILLRLRLDGRAILCKPKRGQCLEMGACLGLLLAVSWIIFVSKGMAAHALRYHFTNAQYFEYLPFPLVVWAAIRFQTWGAVVASLIVSVLAIAGTLNQTGPFVIQTPNLQQGILLLQVFIGIVTATALLLSAAVSERQRAERQLRASLERDRILGEVALRIRQSLDLSAICQTAVEEVRQLLQADRVYIGHLDRQEPLKITAESVQPDYPSLLQGQDNEQLFADFRSLLSHPDTLIADNIAQLEVSPSLRQYYHRYRVKAALVVPLTSQQSLLGLLVVHQCSQVRHWQKSEVRLIEQLATQISIAIQQAQLYQQVQALNCNLEAQVQERTAQLQEKIEEVQQLHAMKTVFLQAVAHDLRTSIMGLLMLLKNLQTRPGESLTLSRTILDRIVQGSDRQLTLINALSENHFAQHQPLSLHRQNIRLQQWIQPLLDHWQPLFEQHQSQITLALPSNLPAIAADPTLLQEVFEHLLHNTLQHNPPGVQLLITARLQRGMLALNLTDNGVGMTSQQSGQLFNLYVRSFHNPRLTGIGLGSYQCRQVIEAHGGKIGVHSQPHIGTQIWFTLPLAATQTQENASQPLEAGRASDRQFNSPLDIAHHRA